MVIVIVLAVFAAWFSLGFTLPRRRREPQSSAYPIASRTNVIFWDGSNLNGNTFICDEVDYDYGLIQWSLKGEHVFTLQARDFHYAEYDVSHLLNSSKDSSNA